MKTLIVILSLFLTTATGSEIPGAVDYPQLIIKLNQLEKEKQQLKVDIEKLNEAYKVERQDLDIARGNFSERQKENMWRLEQNQRILQKHYNFVIQDLRQQPKDSPKYIQLLQQKKEITSELHYVKDDIRFSNSDFAKKNVELDTLMSQSDMKYKNLITPMTTQLENISIQINSVSALVQQHQQNRLAREILHGTFEMSCNKQFSGSRISLGFSGTIVLKINGNNEIKGAVVVTKAQSRSFERDASILSSHPGGEITGQYMKNTQQILATGILGTNLTIQLLGQIHYNLQTGKISAAGTLLNDEHNCRGKWTTKI